MFRYKMRLLRLRPQVSDRTWAASFMAYMEVYKSKNPNSEIKEVINYAVEQAESARERIEDTPGPPPGSSSDRIRCSIIYRAFLDYYESTNHSSGHEEAANWAATQTEYVVRRFFTPSTSFDSKV